GGLHKDAGILVKKLEDRTLGGVRKELKAGFGEPCRGEIELADHLPRLAPHALAAGMGILNVEDRIVLGLLDNLGEIEIKWGVILAHQHHETERGGAGGGRLP